MILQHKDSLSLVGQITIVHICGGDKEDRMSLFYTANLLAKLFQSFK